MICNKCGTQNVDGATFCSECGASLTQQAQPQAQYAPESYGTPTFSNTDASAPKFEEITGDDDLPF